MSPTAIKAIKRSYSKNVFFAEELKKRKLRSKAIGENFEQAQYQEIVWLDFTFKLKAWALKNDFDCFVYANDKEGNGEDTFVALRQNQVKSTGQFLYFQEDKYLSEMPSIIQGIVKNYNNKPFRVAQHVLWGQQNPMCYWE